MILAALLLSALAGCGRLQVAENPSQTESGQQSDTVPSVTGNQEENGDGTGENTAMGRYVETPVDLSDLLGRPLSMTRQEDGTLIILDANVGKVVSKDNGETWQKEGIAGISDMAAFSVEHYITDMKIASDGTIVVLEYSNDGADGGVWDASTVLWIFGPDGSQQTIDVPMTQEEGYFRSIWFSPEGLIYGFTMGENEVYEIQPEDGSSRKYMTVERTPDLVQFQGNYMIMENSETGVLVYDRQAKSYLEDEVLKDFIRENYMNDYYAFESYTMFAFPGEDNILYIAGNEGLHRHVLGGSAMELVIDGSLSSFGNPSVDIVSMLLLPDNEFLTLFTGGKLVKYIYDPDMPTVPAGTLTVYSLTDQTAVRQAISQFQILYPNVFVEYEIGMEGTDSTTREDAIKNLNTRIMAGQGPDVLILDNLPVSSYVERGVLLDLNDHVQDMTGNGKLLSNIVESFTEDGKLYMLPTTFGVHVMAGAGQKIQEVSGLPALADYVEKLREENEGKEILPLFSEEAAVAWFLSTSAPAFLEDGVDTEMISDYLTQIKRIYEACNEGISKASQDMYSYRREYFNAIDQVTTYSRVNMQSMNYVVGNNVFMEGLLKDYFGYQDVISVKRVEGLENTTVEFFNGYSEGIFYPFTLVGVNAASQNTEQALAFFDTMMSKEVQGLLYDGFAVNEEAWEDLMYPDWGTDAGPGEICGSVGTSSLDGTSSYGMDIYVPFEEEVQELRELLYSVHTPYISDPVLEQVLVEEGASYFRNHVSLDGAIKNIQSRISLYMAE